MKEAIKIILIDDNTDFLFTMGTFLSRNGFAVHTAEGGKEGIELVQKEKPNVILLDIMMESLFMGFEVCKTIKSDPELAHIPVIGVSAISEDLGVKPQKYADDDYFSPDLFIEKPVDKDELLKNIDLVLQKAEDKKNRPGWKKALDEIEKKKK